MKAALLYGSTTGRTAAVAELVRRELGDDLVRHCADLRTCRAADLARWDLLVIGVPTWYVGELQDDCQRVAAELQEVDLSRTRFVLFGCGDQHDYPDHFVDALGLMHDQLVARGARNSGGHWPVDGYRFVASRALRGGRFCGLPLDENNQAALTPQRVAAWCAQVRAELGLPARSDRTRPDPSAHAA